MQRLSAKLLAMDVQFGLLRAEVFCLRQIVQPVFVGLMSVHTSLLALHKVRDHIKFPTSTICKGQSRLKAKPRTMSSATSDPSSIVLTCGPLSLTIPKSCHPPKLNVRPDTQIVDVSLCNFSGTLTFEVCPSFISRDEKASFKDRPQEPPSCSLEVAPNSASVSSLPASTPQTVPSLPQTPTLEQSLQRDIMSPPDAPTSIVTGMGASLSPPMSGPGSLSPSLPLNNVPLTQKSSLSASADDSEQLSQFQSQSQPESLSQAPSQSFTGHLPDAQALTQSPFSQSQSMFTNSQSTSEDSQYENNASQSLQFSAGPLSQQFSIDDVPQSPPTSDDGNGQNNSDDLLPPILNFDSIMKEKTPPKKNKEKTQRHPSALARAHERMHKQGKRVRFDENPVIVGTPPLKKPALSTPVHINSNHEMLDPSSLASQLPPHSKCGASVRKEPVKNRSPFGAKKPLVMPKKPPSPKKTSPKKILPSKSSPVKSQEADLAAATPPQPLTPTISPAQPNPWVSVATSEVGRPAERWGATFTPLDNESVLLVGGESKTEDFFQDAIVYNVPASTWLCDETRPPSMPSARAWHSATKVGDLVLVFGGEEQKEKNGTIERTPCNSALVYDGTYRTWYSPSLQGTPPSPRAGHCSALIPGTKNVAFFGGISSGGTKWMSDLYILDDMCMWKKIRVSATKSAKPPARSYSTLTPISVNFEGNMAVSSDKNKEGGFLVLFGGNNKVKSFNDVHFYISEASMWVEPVVLGRAPKPRTGHCAVASKDGRSVIVYGGWDDQGMRRIFFSDVWVLRIESQTECHWTCIHAGNNAEGSVPGPRTGAAMCGTVGKDETETLVFGGWHQTTYYNDITRLEVAANGRVKVSAHR